MKQYNKLVRDRVPAIITASGHKMVTRTLVGKELLAALRAKVDEELAEYDAALDDHGAAAELADLLEVIMAIGRQRGYDEARIGELRAAKTLERGTFGIGYFLIQAE